MHSNELTLKRLFCWIDGVTVGLKSFTGTIGKKLENCETMAVACFVKIFSDDLPVYEPHIVKFLSKDQQYLYKSRCTDRKM